MKNKSVYVAFIFGFGVGFAASGLFFKKRYADRADEEIKSVIATFNKNRDKYTSLTQHPDEKENREEVYVNSNKPNIMEYTAKLKEDGYLRYHDPEPEAPVEEASDMNEPYVITPEEYQENEDYDIISLLYFADGVLADEGYDRIENVDEVVGESSLNHFGEYEEDCVYVQNDKLRTVYEILLDERNYRDAIKTIPHPREE